jgi:hypothetical protein
MRKVQKKAVKKEQTINEKLSAVSAVANKDDFEKIFTHEQHDQFTDLEIKLSENKTLVDQDLRLIDEMYSIINKK